MITTSRVRIHIAATCVTVVLLGCQADLPLPEGARIACSTDADCTPGYVCPELLGSCVAADNPDREPPSLVGAPDISPTVGKLGTRFVVKLEVNEPLGLAPVLRLQDGANDVAPALVEAPPGLRAGVYVFEYFASGDEGTQAPLVVWLIDRSGNHVEREAGVLHFDFVAPTGQDAQWSAPSDRAVVNPQELLAFAVKISQDVIEVVAHLLDEEGEVLAVLSTVLSPSDQRVTGTVALDALSLQGASSVRVDFLLRDMAGNETPPGTLQTPPLTIDAIAPVAIIHSPPASPSTEILPTIEFGSLDADVVSFMCTINGVSIDPCESPQPREALPLGTNTFRVRAVDLAGNIQAPPTEHTWEIQRRWSVMDGGTEHSCALATDHTLWCWGDNRYGALGIGTSGPLASTSVPSLVSGPMRWKAVSTGAEHTCGISREGSLWCWGRDNFGQLGVGAFAYPEARKEVPTQVGTFTDWSAVAAGAGFTCGIRTAPTTEHHELWCWGALEEQPDKANLPQAWGDELDWLQLVARGDQICGVREDSDQHSAWCWGKARGGAGAGPMTEVHTLPGEPGWKQLSAGHSHACGVRLDGTLWCWGDNQHGQLGVGEEAELSAPIHQVGTFSDWSHVVAGGMHTCGSRGGSVYCWGDNRSGAVDRSTVGIPRFTPTEPIGESGAATLGAGDFHSCFITEDGELMCWGRNASGQLGRGSPHADAGFLQQVDGHRWLDVAAGGEHTCAIDHESALWCWGDNTYGQLGDGTVIFRDIPSRVGEASDWIAVAVGGSHTCGLRSGEDFSELWCWGDNHFGQVGQDGGDVLTPTKLASLNSPQDIALGRFHSCAISEERVWCWGALTCPEGICPTPTQITTDGAWTGLAAGDDHTCAIEKASTAYCWGENEHGQAGQPASPLQVIEPAVITDAEGAELTGWTALRAGRHHTCGLQGTELWCWGSSAAGQLEPFPTTYGTHTPINAAGSVAYSEAQLGGDSTCAIRANGEFACWGSDEYGVRSAIGADNLQFSRLSVGSEHACAIDMDKSLWCWGTNGSGQLGVADLWGDIGPIPVPP